MNKALPDKWVRKAIYEAINNMVVDGITVPNYDFRVSGSNQPTAYTLISTQSNLVDQSVKCGHRWENTTVVEVFVKYLGTGNPGSRLLADNILDEVRSRTQSITLDVASSMVIQDQTETYPNDLVTITEDENIFRKFVRYELLIN